MAFAATAYSTRRLFPVDPIYVADYTTLRGITTGSMLCFVTGYYAEEPDITTAGWFIRDDNDTTSADDGTNVIVASNGKRWKRINADITFPLMGEYTDLRAYTGNNGVVYVTGRLNTLPSYIAGIFIYDSTDTTSADNDGTIIVGTDGRRWKRQQSDNSVEIEWFKTTVTDNWTNAVHAAFTYAAANGSCVRVGARDYRITSKIIAGDTTTTKVFSVIGAGQESSQFIFEGGASVGFELACPERSNANGGAMVLHGFSILKNADASSAWGGTALTVTTGTVTGGNPSLTCSLSNITVGGAKTDTTFAKRFENGITLVNCWQAQVSNIFVTGAIPLNKSTTNWGIKWQDSTGSRVTNVHAYRFQSGFYVSGSSEGPSFVNCVAVGVQDGMYVEGPSTTDPSNPGLDVTTCHFNVMRYGIWADNRAQGNINGNLFYERSDTDSSIYKCIYMTGKSRQWVIANNTFTEKSGTTATSKIAVHLDGTSYNVVQGNQIRGSAAGDNWTRGVHFGATVTESACLDNLMNAPADIQFQNNSNTPETIRFRGAMAGGSPFNTWGLESTALTIPNNAATLLSFTTATQTGNANATLADSTVDDDGALVTRARIVVPRYASRVRLTGNLSWDANTTGTRLIEVFHNSAAVRGMPAIRTNATSALAAQVGFVTSPVDVVPGDRFTVSVTQTSGADLNLQVSTRCYVTLEILA